MKALLIVYLIICLQYGLALNILAIISLPLKSHYMAFGNLFRALAAKGHHVIVINNYPDDDKMDNLEFVNLEAEVIPSKYFLPLEFYEKIDSSYLHLYNIYRHLSRSIVVKNDCVNLLNETKVKSLVNKKIDVIFVEQFMSDCALAYAGTFYESPIIGITSHVLIPWAYPRLGIPFNIGKDAFYFSNSGPYPTLYEKVESALLYNFFNIIGKWINNKEMYDAFNEQVPEKLLDLKHISRERLKMIFSYQHHSLTGARLLAPQLLEIGGMHIGKPKPVPEIIESFITESKHGVVYFSFGSNLKSSSMSPKKLEVFTKAFKKIPQRVLMKWENATFPVGNDNILPEKWMPQLDVLCHPGVVGFITHGGMLSMSESAYCGKPVLVIPFFGDQFANAASAVASGLGVRLHFEKATEDTLVDSLKKLTSKELKQSAEKVSELFRDRPISALDSAIYWTEYVARYKTAPSSLPTKEETLFEYFYLDVIVIICFIILLLFLLFLFILKVVKFLFVKSFDLFKRKYYKNKID